MGTTQSLFAIIPIVALGPIDVISLVPNTNKEDSTLTRTYWYKCD